MGKSDLIEKYIQQKASEEELETITRLMAEDAVFKEEVSFHLALRQAVKKEENQTMKLRLQQLEQRKMKRLQNVQKLWKIAAVLVVGLGVFWLFNRSTDYEKIYVANFKPYPNIVAPTVRDPGATESNKENAFRYYDQRDYAKAAAAFKEWYNEDKTGYANFYYGISLMADNRVGKAVEVLADPGWEVPEKYRSQTDWYLALGYLKTENKEKAMAYLEKVLTDGTRAEQAREILKKIK